MGAWIEILEQQSKLRLAVAAILLALCIGVFDYLTGTHVSLSVFYLLPVSLAAWFIGAGFALFIAALSVAVWMIGNVSASNPDFANPFLVAWNATIQLMSFVVVVFVLVKLRSLNQVLESRVRERAAALTREIAERDRLQHLLLEASEQEQRRIGQDLHDGLGQHLAGTAIAGQVLRDKLERRRLHEAADAKKVVELIEEGVHQIQRCLPKGDKEMRLRAQTATIENGFVYLPREAHWLAEYLFELTTFPITVRRFSASPGSPSADGDSSASSPSATV